MRIAFNATSLLSPLTGIGQYSRHLAIGLAGHHEIDVDFFYGVAWGEKVHDTPSPVVSSLLPWIRTHIPFSYELRRALQGNRFARHAGQNRFDIYHEPNTLPLPFDGPMVITVHDLSWIRHPQAHPPERVRAMSKYFEPGLRKASLVLTDSEFVKRELIDVFGVQSDLIMAVPLGVDALFRPRTVDETYPVLSRHGLTHGRYLLVVGTLEPRKNIQVALHSYMQLPSQLRKQYPLLLVGMKGWNTTLLEQQIEPLVRRGEVRLLGYLPREDLASLISGASALVFPSVYEGFGLPPLEAMACGVPVIASDVASIPEVVGDAGVLINPHDVDAFAEAIQGLLTDSNQRTRLSSRALMRSKEFTWERCIEQTVDAYRHVLKEGRR